MFQQFQTRLYTPVDNSPLIVFRICFGLLILLESAGAIATGWVKKTLIDPEFTFTFMGFEWLQPLAGNGMYYYFALMAFCSLLVILGWYYRVAMLSFAILWTSVYWMQKTSYNNHYYLMVLLSWWMVFLPANRYFSLDVRRKPQLKILSCPQWCLWVLLFQVCIVYFFASFHKIHPDWLAARPIEIWFKAKASMPVIGSFLQTDFMKWFVAYGGILFDGLIVPFLLWKRTRWFAVGVSLFFHLFNSIVFQIGVFPYMMIAFLVFFFPPEQIRAFFFRKKPSLKPYNLQVYAKHHNKIFITIAFVAYFVMQLYLPIRHHFYEGNVNWTEEGHRMAWRMMLRSKSGTVHFTVKHPTDGTEERIYPKKRMTAKQARAMAVRPDMIWQFTQRLKQEYAEKGQTDVEIYAVSKVSLNGRPRQALVDPNVDLAQISWQRFEHKTWLLPLQE